MLLLMISMHEIISIGRRIMDDDAALLVWLRVKVKVKLNVEVLWMVDISCDGY